MGFEAITGPNFIVPTAPSGDSSNRVADTAFVAAAIAATSGAIKTVKVQTFTSNGTYTPSTGMLYCIVELLGGGGAGGGTPITSATQCAAGGGGGAGGYTRGVFSSAAIGVSQSVSVGAAATGNSGLAGSNGTDNTFGALLTANKGTGGPVGILSTTTTIAGGAGGGSASGGSVNINGQTGYDGWAFIASAGVILAQGGAGGSSVFGGAGTVAMTPSTVITGVGATGFGSGGSGAAAGESQGQGTGGGGSAGICIVTEFCSQ